MANSDYKSTGRGDFTPIADVAAAVDYLDTEIPLEKFNLPRSASLDVDNLVVLIDEEWMAVDQVLPDKIIVRRGCGDTVPAQHSEATEAWFVTGAVGADGKEHVGGDEVAIKLSPGTIGGGTYPIEKAPPNDLKMNWRFFRPYAPGRMTARELPWFQSNDLSADLPDLPLAWAHRDRVLQADQMVGHEAASIGPEPGTTYTARIYNKNDELKRTEMGLTGTAWTYTWLQAMADLGYTVNPEGDEAEAAKIRFCSTRDGFDSWQDYTIPFRLITAGEFMRVAQMMGMVAQPTGPDAGTPPDDALMVGQYNELAAQEPGPETPDSGAVPFGLMAAGMRASAGQLTSFYTPLNRNLFESPYAWLQRGPVHGDPACGHVTTVVARPSDRLTDSHRILAREDYPVGSGAAHYFQDVDAPTFTPWITLSADVSYLDEPFMIRTSSFFDGVPLTSVLPGQVALVDAEVVRVKQVLSDRVVFARGCFDTVPAKHKADARVWFFEAMSGNDPTDYAWRTRDDDNRPITPGGAAQIKMIPSVYGPALLPNDVPTDRVDFARRGERPYPPGRVEVKGARWYEGAITIAGETTVITWAHRNRLTQGGEAVDHDELSRGAEVGQQYRISIKVSVPSRFANTPPSIITIRNMIVDGEQFDYTYEMALADGNRAGRALGICGTVSVGMRLEAIRDGLVSWQSYTIMLRLPSYRCAPGETPGGGQVGVGDPDNGNGQVGGGGDPADPSSPGNEPGQPGEPTGGDDQGQGPKDPVDNGSGDNGTGPPKPPEPPDNWPDPIDPPPEPPFPDPNPQLAGHWDLNWDKHYDARPRDDEGDN